MTLLIEQSTTQQPLPFYLTSSTDHISGLTGKAGTVTVKISKNGATGVTPSGAISEVDATNNPGLYQVAGNATDTNTLGYIWITATVSGADQSDACVAQVVAFNPQNANLGLSNVSANMTQISGSTVSTSTAQLGVNAVNIAGQAATLDGNNLLKVDVEDINGNATAAQNVSKANQAIGRGTCTTGGATTSVTTSAWSPGGSGVVSNQFQGRTIIFDANTTTAALQGQATNITANTSGATPTFTVGALTNAPASGDTFGVY